MYSSDHTGDESRWAHVHETFETLKAISHGQTTDASCRAMFAMLTRLGFDGGIIANAPIAPKTDNWTLLAASPDHDDTALRSHYSLENIAALFAHGKATPIAPQIEGPVEPSGMAGDLLAYFSGSGIAQVTAVYLLGEPGIGNLALLACHREAEPADPPGARDLSLLEVSLIALAERIATHGPSDATTIPRVERSVLWAFAHGHSPSEIAEARGTSIRTVRNQLDSARRRLKARTNAHAVMIAVRSHGLLCDDADD